MRAPRVSTVERYIRRRVKCANLLPVTAAEWDALLAEAMAHGHDEYEEDRDA